MKKHYYKITDGSNIEGINKTGLLGSGKDLHGWYDTKIEGILDIYNKGYPVGSIEPIHDPKEIELYNQQCPKPIDPVSLIPRINWSVIERVKESTEIKEIDFDCLDTPEESIQHILTGLERGEVGSLVSSGGTGKSYLALHNSMLMSLGLPSHLSRSQIPRKVLYLSLEDKIKGIRNRARRIFKSEQWGENEKKVIKKNFRAIPTRLCLYDENKDPNWVKINDLFKDKPHPDLLIIDTARRAHNLDENSSGDMNAYMSLLEAIGERYQCAVLILHHTSKAATWGKARGEDVGAGAARGSSAVVDNGRGTWVMVKLPKDYAKGLTDEERSRCVLLEHEKCNAERALDPAILERTPEGILKPLSDELKNKINGEKEKSKESPSKKENGGFLS